MHTESYVTFWKAILLLAFCGEMLVAVLAGSLGWRDVKALLKGLAERHESETEAAAPADP